MVGGDTNIKTVAGGFAVLTKHNEAKAVLSLATFPDDHKLTGCSIAAQQAELFHTTSQLQSLISTSQLQSLISTRKKNGTASDIQSQEPPLFGFIT
jgi:hypothetical protein